MFRFRHHRMLGTVVDVEVDCPRARDARLVDDTVGATIARLESTLSAYDPTSELQRWKRGEVAAVSTDLAALMALSLRWQERSGGAYNPATGELSALWARAVELGQTPGPDELAAAAAAVAAPRYQIGDDGQPIKTGDCGPLAFNALAKGWIVDRALAAAQTVTAARGLEVSSVLVNAGGDLAHAGNTPVDVAIENPLRPYDNTPPLTVVAVANAAVATSGRARRGFRIGERFYGHVIDPRTAVPADHLASISVVAPDCATADVLATIAGLLAPAAAVAYAEQAGAACLAVDLAGAITSNARWDGLPTA